MKIKTNNISECYGCTACMTVCPVEAITMEQNDEGFFYPIIDQSLCVNCGKCGKVCPIQTELIGMPIKMIAAKNLDTDSRLDSSSGGVFSLLASYVEQMNGVIYGATYDKDFSVVHCRADENKWKQFCGSKYVQSNLGNVFSQVISDLKADRYVLFSGTPCQIEGLRKTVNVSQVSDKKLILVDILCHGTPSPLIWNDWLKTNFRINSIGKISFRDKKETGWHDSLLSVWNIEGKCIYSGSQRDSVYFKLFFNHLILKPSCHICPFSSFSRSGDITLGDYWGVERKYPEFDDDKGVSLVLINNERGMRVWKSISSMIDGFEVNMQDCIQPNLKAPSKESPYRILFWKIYRKKGLNFACKYLGIGYKNSIDKLIFRIIRKMDRIVAFIRN